MLSKLKNKLYHKWREISGRLSLKKALASGNDLKIVIGSSNFFQPGWVGTEMSFLNVLNLNDWDRFFNKNQISNVLAEHVWEHLTPEQGQDAIRNCYAYMKPGGRIRIAVPDGFSPDENYINHVKVNGTGAGADDHKILYNINILSEFLSNAGFKVHPLEWYSEEGAFNKNDWSVNDGMIMRSIENDERNKDGKVVYTSLIVDGIK